MVDKKNIKHRDEFLGIIPKLLGTGENARASIVFIIILLCFGTCSFLSFCELSEGAKFLWIKFMVLISLAIRYYFRKNK